MFRLPTSIDRSWLISLVALSVLVAVSTASGCVEIEPDPPLDDEGEPLALPGPHDRWLEVTSISPSGKDLALSPRVAVTFNDYIDDDSFRSYTFASLTSGGLSASGFADYVMTDKTVIWRPYGELEPDFLYTFGISEEIVSATGSPLLLPAEWPTYVTREDAEQPAFAELPDARFDEVEPIFEAHCVECHRDEDSGLNPLTYDSLMGTRSTQTSLYLVRPGDPADSYLMRKLLWDYPDIEFTHQPPPWVDGAKELAREDLLTIEGWIASGAGQ
ncbi:MAG: Ig-like domain-containing protein [Persicimonas sp.]